MRKFSVRGSEKWMGNVNENGKKLFQMQVKFIVSPGWESEAGTRVYANSKFERGFLATSKLNILFRKFFFGLRFNVKKPARRKTFQSGKLIWNSLFAGAHTKSLIYALCTVWNCIFAKCLRTSFHCLRVLHFVCRCWFHSLFIIRPRNHWSIHFKVVYEKWNKPRRRTSAT